MTTNDTTPQAFPQSWLIAKDFDPNDHLIDLKGKDYLTVQYRLLWFVRDQRELIATGLARMPYIVQTDLVEMDRQTGYAHFKTYVRDVLGNEATMYGSESAKDFADYAEKASTKSLGRALLALGYGTAAAPEMDEGERVVDSPVERKTPPRATTATTAPASATTSTNTAKRPSASPQPRTQPQAKPVVPKPQPEPEPEDIAGLHSTLRKRLRDSDGLKDLYMDARKYGLKGEQFFKELLTVTKLPSGALAQPLSAAAIKPMKKYVADMAKEAQEAAARTPDLATVATPGVRP